VRLLTLPGVFRPISDSRMLARAVAGRARGRAVLDVCTGSGIVALAAARAGARDVAAIDVSRRATATVRLNARVNGVRVRALRGDLLEPVTGERFDVIASNPPYVPSPSDDLPRRGAARAWEGGRDGRAFLDRLVAAAPDHLAPGGELLVVHSSIIGTDRTLDAMRAAGLEAEVLERHPGELGPLMSARARDLEARGLLDPGRRAEEVVIVRGALSATRPRPRPDGPRSGPSAAPSRPGRAAS
jgi:release factor glutamine methyltransferase